MSQKSPESEDEIFAGRMCLKEIKKRFLKQRLELGIQNDPAEPIFDEDYIRIIETKSEPDLTEVPDLLSCDLSTELINLCDDIEEVDLNSTTVESKKHVFDVKMEQASDYDNHSYSDSNLLVFKDIKPIKHVIVPKYQYTYKTPKKTEKLSSPKSVKKEIFITPSKPTKDTEVFSTPTNEGKHKTPIFKTPANPLSSSKKIGSATKSSYPKNKAYEHIKSPIGFYIKNSAQVPLIQNVKGTKPLAGASSIPVPVKVTTNVRKFGKENMELPKHAYMSSKNTVVSSESETKLPTKYAKKLMSSVPRPMVIRHALRENVTTTKGLNQDNSFADLTLYQAETSVCTQKVAFS